MQTQMEVGRGGWEKKERPFWWCIPPSCPADAKDAKPEPCNFAAFSLLWLQLQLMERRQMEGWGRPGPLATAIVEIFSAFLPQMVSRRQLLKLGASFEVFCLKSEPS